MSSKYKNHKTLLQAWVIHDEKRDSRKALAVRIWNHFKPHFHNRTSDLMTEAMIALNEKYDNGFEVVPDETPKVVNQMKSTVDKLQAIAEKLSSLNLQSATAITDANLIVTELTDAVKSIEFQITSDEMTFDDDDSEDW